MKIIGRFIHGSEDSTDVDIHYIVDELPDLTECKRFCSEDPNENRNLIVIKNGRVVDTYKGSVDEINNGMIDTYYLHAQNYPLTITERMPRNKLVKYIRGIRGILSHLSRSQYRPEIKKALKGTWQEKLDTLYNIDLTAIDFTVLNNNMTKYDIIKLIAFQLGQMQGLADGKELYTKADIGEVYRELNDYLYRKDKDLTELNDFLYQWITYLKRLTEEKEIFVVEDTPDTDIFRHLGVTEHRGKYKLEGANLKTEKELW